MSHLDLHRDAGQLLANWQAPNHSQAALREAFLGFLGLENATARECVPGHLTASVFVFTEDRSSLLLTLHPRVGRWLQLGGHCESTDLTIAGAALREATEESGIAGLTLDPAPLSLDVHPIKCSLGIPTRHFDIRFLASCPPAARPDISEESLDLRFFPVSSLPDLEPGMIESIGWALERGEGLR